jgi:hypothetical protein
LPSPKLVLHDILIRDSSLFKPVFSTKEAAAPCSGSAWSSMAANRRQSPRRPQSLSPSRPLRINSSSSSSSTMLRWAAFHSIRPLCRLPISPRACANRRGEDRGSCKASGISRGGQCRWPGVVQRRRAFPSRPTSVRL